MSRERQRRPVTEVLRVDALKRVGLQQAVRDLEVSAHLDDSAHLFFDGNGLFTPVGQRREQLLVWIIFQRKDDSVVPIGYARDREVSPQEDRVDAVVLGGIA